MDRHTRHFSGLVRHRIAAATDTAFRSLFDTTKLPVPSFAGTTNRQGDCPSQLVFQFSKYRGMDSNHRPANSLSANMPL